MVFRLRNVLALVVTLLVIGSSSQGAVCGLACGLPAAGCHAVPRVTVSMESKAGMAMGGDCDHEMKGASVPAGADAAASCAQPSCGHVATTVFDKGGSAPSFVPTMQWVTTGVVPVDGMMVGGGMSGGMRPPLLLRSGRSLLTSLRV